MSVLELKAGSQLQCSLSKEVGAQWVYWLIYANWLIDWLNVLELKAGSQLQCSLWKEDGAQWVDWLIYANRLIEYFRVKSG